MRQDNAQKGSVAEGMFYAECLQRGKNVCLPMTPTQYDCIVSSDGVLKRVQVKSVSAMQWNKGGEKVKCMLVTGRKGKRAYDTHDTDLIALFVAPIKEWYIFPIEKVAGKMTIALFPTVKNSRSQYEVFRNRWDLI